MTDRREQEKAIIRARADALARFKAAKLGSEDCKVAVDRAKPDSDKTAYTSNAGPVVYVGERFVVIEQSDSEFLIFEGEKVVAECQTKLAADIVVVSLESTFKGASVQRVHELTRERDLANEGWSNCKARRKTSREECEALREALSKALSYCDAAVHQTEQYHDEREELYRMIPYLENDSSDPSLPMNRKTIPEVPAAWRSREKGSTKWRVHTEDPSANLKAYANGEYEVEPLYSQT